MTELSEIMVTKQGSVDPSKAPNESFDLLSIPAYDQGEPQVIQGCEIGSTKKRVQPNDVLLSRIVPHIRRAWVVPPIRSRRQIASSEWIVFRSDKIWPSYLRHVLMADEFHHQFMNTVAGVGGSLMRARPEFVKRIKIYLPKLAEQRRIAAILDKADAIRRKRRRAIELTDQFLKSAFLELFGDPVTNPKSYRRVCLHELADGSEGIKCGPFGTQLSKSEFQGEGVPLWGIKHVNRDFSTGTVEFLTPTKAKTLNQYSLVPGDLVMTRKGTIGNCAIYPASFPDGVMHSDLLRIRLNSRRCVSKFVMCQLVFSQHVEHQISLLSQGAIMAGINVTKLKQIELLEPPLAEQIRFGDLFDKRLQAQQVQFSQNRLEDNLFNSLVQRAFRGELTG